MCDTMVALGDATADGAVIFGKNSDREPNEAHHLLRAPAAAYPAGAKVKCTYIEVPQAPETFEVILAKPFWIWGAEMGANEHGVAIGNEAVFTRVPYDKQPGLIGMDLLRLALERSRTARAAVDVITGLIDRFGQGGDCGFDHHSFYHNSFLIADPGEAWVLETAGRQWAAERARGIRSISNALTIGREWDLASPDLVAYAVDRGWCKGRDDFHFARCYSDPFMTRFNCSRDRRARTAALLEAERGRITPSSFMRVLRDHGPRPAWNPAGGLLQATVCWHAGFGPVRAYQTTGSMVSHLASSVQTHFATGTAAPCTSVFKPLWPDVDLPDTGLIPTGDYDEAVLFWRHEALHRATLRDYPGLVALYGGERDELEEGFIAGALARAERPAEERQRFAADCWAAAAAAEERWAARVAAAKPRRRLAPLYRLAWRGFNRRVGMRRPLH